MTKYQEIGRAELKVDCYDGKTFDQHRPTWHGFFDGDRDGGEIGGTLTLDVSNFRPGTIITISEPVCPDCHASREECERDDDCAFNWRGWDEDRYA